jgi:hypothetical protein
MFEMTERLLWMCDSLMMGRSSMLVVGCAGEQAIVVVDLLVGI